MGYEVLFSTHFFDQIFLVDFSVRNSWHPENTRRPYNELKQAAFVCC